MRMERKVFNFDDQLQVGYSGESDFIKIYEKLEPKKEHFRFKI